MVEQYHTTVLPVFIHRERWLGEVRIGKRSDRYSHVLLASRDAVMHDRSASWAEVKCDPVAGIGDSDVGRGITFDLDALPPKSRLSTKYTSGAALTSEAVANGNSDRFPGHRRRELAATAGCGACNWRSLFVRLHRL